MLVAIDTATALASIALFSEDRVQAERTWYSDVHHTVEVMPNMVDMLRQLAVTPGQLTAVAVSLGPGSFTGLRVGLSIAKGLCLSQKISIVGVPTLDVVAYPHLNQPLPVCALIKAGRGRLCGAIYRHLDGEWQRASDYRLGTADELSSTIMEKTLFCGEIDMATERSLARNLGDKALFAPAASCLRRAGYLAELGWRRLQQSQEDDPTTLSPIYLPLPVT
ncbi:MAG: tRNA (adenosine(37)-N6)-threonylcarbamoyltransferase complex dimerization subunit type 1 TsaB [Anaerolineae bacterium]